MDTKVFIDKIIDKTKKYGAEIVEVIYHHSTSNTTEVRLGKVDNISASNNKSYSIRAITGKSESFVSSSDFSDESVDSVCKRAAETSKILPADKYLGTAEARDFVKDFPDLDLYDDYDLTEQKLIDMALSIDEAGISNKQITNSEGSGAYYSKSLSAIASSKGFFNSHQGSCFSIFTNMIAGSGDNMQGGHAFHYTRHFNDLKSPAEIGKEAAEEAIKSLFPKKIPSGKFTVIMPPKVASMLNGIIASACNGDSIAGNYSFLKDHMGKQILPENINFIDDPLIKRGLSSCDFDGEFFPVYKKTIIENGILKEWFLNIRAANELGLKPNNSAGRSWNCSTYPTSTNLYMTPGKISPNDMIKSVKNGIYITGMHGSGMNMINGDFSDGINGFMIENGEITFPVAEITIAGNALEMFKKLTLANDLDFTNGYNAPHIAIEDMTVAGV